MSHFSGPDRLLSNDPTILALRRALDREAAALNAGEGSTDHLVNAIYACLPHDFVKPVFLPASGTSPPCLAVIFSPEFHQYVAFATEYLAGFIHGDTPLE
jgi:hypothetical protein